MWDVNASERERASECVCVWKCVCVWLCVGYLHMYIYAPSMLTLRCVTFVCVRVCVCAPTGVYDMNVCSLGVIKTEGRFTGVISLSLNLLSAYGNEWPACLRAAHRLPHKSSPLHLQTDWKLAAGAAQNGLFMQISPVDLCQVWYILNSFHQHTLGSSAALYSSVNRIEKALGVHSYHIIKPLT